MQKNNSNATHEHQVKVEGVHFVESWIKEGEQDKSVHLGIDVPINTWLVGGYVENDSLWEEVKAGKVKGFSIEGIYSEAIAADLELQELVESMQSLLSGME
jgi:hypothetical protein